MKIYSISEYVTTEIIIDKSRFIADLFPVNDSSEAISKLDLIKELHPKANHHCYAYIIGYSSEQQKFSDDGEPGGTAGMPILNVLKHEKITNIIAVITRYFGGIKLGAGGLVRAYTAAVKSGLESAKIVEKTAKDLYRIYVSYALADKVKYYLQNNSVISKIDYQDNVIFEFYTDLEQTTLIIQGITTIINMPLNPEYLGNYFI
jgi:uncharacterized YigZ family protein